MFFADFSCPIVALYETLVGYYETGRQAEHFALTAEKIKGSAMSLIKYWNPKQVKQHEYKTKNYVTNG
jgi:hypothetical protein